MQELTGRVSSGVAGRDVAGAAGKRGLLLVDWWFEMQGFPGRLPCGVTVRLRSCCARITCGVLGVRRPFVGLGARPPGVIAASPGGQFCLGFANVAGMAAIVIVTAGDEACRAFVQRVACRAFVQHKACRVRSAQSLQAFVQHQACRVFVQRKACRRLFNTKLAECLFSAKACRAFVQREACRAFVQRKACRAFVQHKACRVFVQRKACRAFAQHKACRVLSSAKPTGVWSVCSV